MGGSINFGYPIDEFQRITLGLGVDKTDVNVNTGVTLPAVITDFTTASGSSYLTYNATARWKNNHLNNGFFPTEGFLHDVTADVAVPGGDISYFKTTYNGRYYKPLNRDQTWVVGLKTRDGYADALEGGAYPFFQNFFAGGLRTVRGYANNS